MRDLSVSFAEEVVNLLRQGNETYLRRGRAASRRVRPASSGTVIAGVLTCSDLKEDLATIFGLEDAELFTMTRAGMMVSRDEIAGASFAADMHGVKLFLILGHSRCDVLDIYLSGGQVTPIGLRDALDDSRRATIVSGIPIVSKPDLVRVHACRMAQNLRVGLGANFGVVVGAAQFDESCGRVLFF
jgi:hypothetical protein